jgi:hypothetical protein
MASPTSSPRRKRRRTAPAFQIDTVTPIDTTSPPVVTASCDTAGATVIAAGANIQTAVNAGSTGQKFILSPGVYRMQSVTPKTNQTFCGDSAIVTGARDLSGATWTSSGSYWYVTGQTQQNSTHLMTDKCQATSRDAIITKNSGWTTPAIST